MMTTIIYPFAQMLSIVLTTLVFQGFPIGLGIGAVYYKYYLPRENKLLFISLVIVLFIAQIGIDSIVYTWFVGLTLPSLNISILKFIYDFVLAKFIGFLFGFMFGFSLVCYIVAREDAMGWDAFCDTHFTETFEHVKNRYKNYSVGYGDAFPPEDEDDMICGYQDCKNVATKEIYWIKQDAFKGKKFVPYKIGDENESNKEIKGN